MELPGGWWLQGGAGGRCLFLLFMGFSRQEYWSGCSQVFMPLSMSLDVAGICSATAKTSTCRYGLKEGLQRDQLPSLFESACSLNPWFSISAPTSYTLPSEHLPTSYFQLPFGCKVCPFPQHSQRGPGRQTCMGASFQNQLVHRIPFWHLGLVMCLWGYLLLGNGQLKFESDLGNCSELPWVTCIHI